jgi:hypothetical protein
LLVRDTVPDAPLFVRGTVPEAPLFVGADLDRDGTGVMVLLHRVVCVASKLYSYCALPVLRVGADLGRDGTGLIILLHRVACVASKLVVV